MLESEFPLVQFRILYAYCLIKHMSFRNASGPAIIAIIRKMVNSAIIMVKIIVNQTQAHMLLFLKTGA